MLRGLRTSCRSYTGLIIVAYLDLDICIITCFSRLQTLIKIFRSISLVGIHLYTYSWPKLMIHISIIQRGFFLEMYQILLNSLQTQVTFDIGDASNNIIISICYLLRLSVCGNKDTRPDTKSCHTNRKLSYSLFSVMVMVSGILNLSFTRMQ